MENSIGIEAARARLGDLADEARDTGQVTSLTRYGKTVAVIGPAEAVKPRATIAVYLNFPHEDWEVEMHAVPRIGDTLEWGTGDGDTGQWTVTEVIWTPERDQPGAVGLTLDPANEHTERIMARQDAEHKAKARAANATTEK
jgi:hypothetical protein